jgi:hypothetical protein
MRERDRRIPDDRRFRGTGRRSRPGLNVPALSKAGVDPEVDVRLPQGQDVFVSIFTYTRVGVRLALIVGECSRRKKRGER